MATQKEIAGAKKYYSEMSQANVARKRYLDGFKQSVGVIYCENFSRRASAQPPPLTHVPAQKDRQHFVPI